MNFVQTAEFDCCHSNRKAKFANKFSNIISSEAIRAGRVGGGAGVKLKLVEMFITLASTKVTFPVDVALVLLLLWQLKISIEL